LTTEFWAIVGKVQTMADGGIRVYLDLPETAIVQMAELAAYKINSVVVDVVVTPRQDSLQNKTGSSSSDEPNGKGRLEKGTKRKSEWSPQETEGPN
jgi:hypothetical protein